MKVWVGALLLAVLPAGATGGDAKADAKRSSEPGEPFYRKYLVPGNPLDDQIAEQEKRIEAEPDDANLRNDFGNLLAQRKFPKEAAEQYEMALKLDPKNFIAAYNLGMMRETEGKVSAAISAYKRSIARKPGFPQSHFRLGRLYEHRGDHDRAIEEYAKAMWIDPEMREPRRNPLVVDSELIPEASLRNYSRDIASAAMLKDSVYADEARFRKMPIDRPLASEETAAAAEPEPAPRDIGPGNAAGSVPTEGAPASGVRHPSRTISAPAEGPGSVLGGRPRPTNVRPRPQPQPAAPPAAAATEPPPAPPQGQDTTVPETMPEPTPTPTPEVPVEVEPS